ncbi:hypothetical protein ACIPPM_22055 [Streptomyces sp. NPDC090119]|uniref:hypothetical protein n=1 Tax=Streptomyces sp. NPDC090119 TaxID=3365951 RepID=UPI00380723C0
MHRIKKGQTYRTCSGGATSHYPATVIVLDDHAPGARTVRVRHEDRAALTYEIPASYFHPTNETTAGRRRITGYFLIADPGN